MGTPSSAGWTDRLLGASIARKATAGATNMPVVGSESGLSWTRALDLRERCSRKQTVASSARNRQDAVAQWKRATLLDDELLDTKLNAEGFTPEQFAELVACRDESDADGDRCETRADAGDPPAWLKTLASMLAERSRTGPAACPDIAEGPKGFAPAFSHFVESAIRRMTVGSPSEMPFRLDGVPFFRELRYDLLQRLAKLCEARARAGTQCCASGRATSGPNRR